MKDHIQLSPYSLCMLLTLVFSLMACNEESILKPQEAKEQHQRLDVGLDELISNAEVVVTVTPRSHGYIAQAKGGGVIPGGEYAGQRFHITMEGIYSGVGFETLTSGEALVRIQHERFESVMDPIQQSFCCGEGHLLIIDDAYVFVMFGQVNHSTADEPHHHLFAGLANAGDDSMTMTIADQTGTIVEPLDPPHDPGIGAIVGFDALQIRVDLH